MSSDQRPPADVAYSEIFFDEKCGYGGEKEREDFFRWCDNPQGTFATMCTNFSGIKGPCEMTLEFLRKNQLPSVRYYVKRSLMYMLDDDDDGDDVTATVSNGVPLSSNPTTKGMPKTSTTASTDLTTLPPPVDEEQPVGIKYDYKCEFGEGKGQTLKGDIRFKQSDDYDKIRTYCHQKIYGVNSTPIWLIILIILLVIAAVAGAGFLFWKYWLKRRVYKKETSRMSSAVESHWTLGPGVSSGASQVSSIRPSSNRSISRSERSKSNRSSRTRPSSNMRSSGKISHN